MTKITIIGAGGRMGCCLIRCIARSQDLQLAGAVESKDMPLLHTDAGTAAGCEPLAVKIESDLDSTVSNADVAIDFSAREALADNLRIVSGHGIHMVIGTTGLDKDMLEKIAESAKRIAIVRAANMSTGINLMLELATRAAAILGLDYDVEIVETHHRHKKDAPSGTALALAEAVAEGRQQVLHEAMIHGREGITGVRPRGEIGMHALRGGDVVGDHTLHFASAGERIELTHRASDREAFALGALRAGRWLAGRPAGLYDMRDVLGLRAPSAG